MGNRNCCENLSKKEPTHFDLLCYSSQASNRSSNSLISLKKQNFDPINEKNTITDDNFEDFEPEFYLSKRNLPNASLNPTDYKNNSEATTQATFQRNSKKKPPPLSNHCDNLLLEKIPHFDFNFEGLTTDTRDYALNSLEQQPTRERISLSRSPARPRVLNQSPGIFPSTPPTFSPQKTADIIPQPINIMDSNDSDLEIQTRPIKQKEFSKTKTLSEVNMSEEKNTQFFIRNSSTPIIEDLYIKDRNENFLKGLRDRNNSLLKLNRINTTIINENLTKGLTSVTEFDKDNLFRTNQLVELLDTKQTEKNSFKYLDPIQNDKTESIQFSKVTFSNSKQELVSKPEVNLGITPPKRVSVSYIEYPNNVNTKNSDDPNQSTNKEHKFQSYISTTSPLKSFEQENISPTSLKIQGDFNILESNRYDSKPQFQKIIGSNNKYPGQFLMNITNPINNPALLSPERPHDYSYSATNYKGSPIELPFGTEKSQLSKESRTNNLEEIRTLSSQRKPSPLKYYSPKKMSPHRLISPLGQLFPYNNVSPLKHQLTKRAVSPQRILSPKKVFESQRHLIARLPLSSKCPTEYPKPMFNQNADFKSRGQILENFAKKTSNCYQETMNSFTKEETSDELRTSLDRSRGAQSKRKKYYELKVKDVRRQHSQVSTISSCNPDYEFSMNLIKLNIQNKNKPINTIKNSHHSLRISCISEPISLY